MRVTGQTLVLGLALGLASCAGEPRPDGPNVVLVVVDTLRADRVSHYGHERDTATALDAFREQATLFTTCRSPASWTSPSVASLFTGLATTRHGVTGRALRLPDAAETLAETLARAGWTTAGWTHNHMVSSKNGFEQGFQLFDDELEDSTDFPDAEVMVERIEAWLATRDADRPFLLYAQPMNAHGPYRVPAEAATTLLGRVPDARFRYFAHPMNGIIYGGKIELRDQVTNAYVRALGEHYDTAVRYTLDQVGALFDALRRQELFDDALVIVTSDHGEELFDHGGFAHGYSLFEEVLRVPLYVKLPGQRDARTVDAPVTLTDLFPTVLEVLGLPAPADLDGRSLVPLCDGTRADLPDEGAPRLFQVKWPSRCVADALVEDGFKLVRTRKNYEGKRREVALYDLAADPGETTNVADGHPERVEAMTERLLGLIEDLEARALEAGEAARMDPARLEALGYTDPQDEPEDG